jgi:steroid 5-alpha reductase family enzyme
VLFAASLVWILSVRLRDASIADVCWGGVTLLEESLIARKPGYSAYVARTPPFFSWFPGGS